MDFTLVPTEKVINDLRLFRSHVEHAPGHSHLYGEFDSILATLEEIRGSGGILTAELAHETLTTVDLLLQENSVGRRPWTGGWEEYFGKCMEDANGLLKEFSAFENCSAFCPAGYCNRFLDSFAYMDHQDRQHDERYPSWSRHFASLASLAAEMFSLVADRQARINEEFLEHPDDNVFTWLLTGYAKSKTSEARVLLTRYLNDEEPWVRRLVRTLLDEYFDAQQSAPEDADKPRK